MESSIRKIRDRVDKRALSNLIAYVLLISITLSLSIMVYGWLKFYVEGSGDEIMECSSNVNIVVSSYSCFEGVDGNLTVVLKNKGLFNVDGFILRVHNESDAEFGYYILERSNEPLKPGDIFNETYDFPDAEHGLTDVTLMDVQPIVNNEDGEVLCRAYTSQKVTCL